MVVMTTPVAQFAKGKIHDVPLIYSVVTDPVDAGLIKEQNLANKNMTGSSDMQNLDSLIKFAKLLLPEAKRIGLLYAILDSNDTALLNMMRTSAASLNMEVVAIPVEQARDVPLRMQEFKDKVDLFTLEPAALFNPHYLQSPLKQLNFIFQCLMPKPKRYVTISHLQVMVLIIWQLAEIQVNWLQPH